MQEVPINRVLNAELEAEQTVLGGPEESDDFIARPAEQPVGVRLRKVFEALDLPVPNECSLHRSFDVWLIPHRVSILRRRGLAEPVSVGIQIEYIHGNKTCSVVSLIPEFQYLQRGVLGAGLCFGGLISVTGDMSSCENSGRIDRVQSFGALSFGLTANGQVGFQFSASVATSVIAAVGKGSARCEWVFHRHQEPLHDRDLETWAVVVLPKRQTELAYRLKLYYLKRTAFFSTRRESDPVEIVCQLAD